MEGNKDTSEWKFVAADDSIKKEDILLATNFVKNEVLENECSCYYSQNVEVRKNVRVLSRERYNGTMESSSSSFRNVPVPTCPQPVEAASTPCPNR